MEMTIPFFKGLNKMPKKQQLENIRFGRLAVISFFGMSKHHKSLWNCRCDCGKQVVVIGGSMLSGRQVSCGCHKIENSAARLKIIATKHGLAGTIYNSTWKGMTQRCYNVEGKDYHRYGARGIRMCEFFRASPANLKLVLGERPFDNSIERVNNDGNYSCGSCAECVSKNWPLNVKWATRIEQGRNQSTNRIIEFKGEYHCLSEWAEKTGIRASQIALRMDRLGWSVKKALTTPIRSSGSLKNK